MIFRSGHGRLAPYPEHVAVSSRCLFVVATTEVLATAVQCVVLWYKDVSGLLLGWAIS